MVLDTNNTLFAVPEGCCPTYDADNPSYSPFANLETSRIKNACKRDEQEQSNYFAQANKAHAIIYGLYARIISREMAIAMLKLHCNREPQIAALNIANSRYARIDFKTLYTERYISLRNTLHKMLNNYTD